MNVTTERYGPIVLHDFAPTVAAPQINRPNRANFGHKSEYPGPTNNKLYSLRPNELNKIYGSFSFWRRMDYCARRVLIRPKSESYTS